MENSLTGLMMAAGTVITCVIISLAFFLAREGRGMVMDASNQMQDTRLAISQQEKLQYDRVFLTGAQVIAAVKKFENNHTVTVTTKKTVLHFPISSMESIYDPAGENYISPEASFWSTLIRNESGVITGFQFTEKEKSS